MSAQRTQGKTSGATTDVAGRRARRDSYRRRTSKQCRLNELKVRPVAPPPMWLDDGQGGTATGAGLQAVSAQRTQGKIIDAAHRSRLTYCMFYFYVETSHASTRVGLDFQKRSQSGFCSKPCDMHLVGDIALNLSLRKSKLK